MTTDVLHTLQNLGSNSGGPSRTVPGLCDGICNMPDFRAVILTGKARPSDHNLNPKLTQVIEIDSSFQFGISKHLSRQFDMHPWSILHDHGQWSAINRSCAAYARSNNVVRVVSPRGMLSPWALNHRKWKKAIAWRLFAKRDIESADLLHATSRLEFEELRSLGITNPVAVIPNGISIEDYDELEYGAKGSKKVVFLSRIHPKKGIMELLEVWDSLKPKDWELIIAGPDEDGLLRTPSTLPSRCRFIGPVDGQEKVRLLQSADLFVLPSFSESFGVVVAESLMAGTPVITTNGTPWKELRDYNCGWWISTGKPELKTTMLDAMNTDPVELFKMGLRGRDFVRSTFCWDSIAERMCRSYKWLLGDIPKPDYIY